MALPRSVKDIRPSAASSSRIWRSVASTSDGVTPDSVAAPLAGCAVTASQDASRRAEPPDAARHRLDVLPGLLRRPGDQAPTTARRSTPCAGCSTSSAGWSSDYQPDPPGLLLGQRLAPAVAGRPDPVVQGAPRGRGGRRAAPDIEEVPDPLEVQVPIILECSTRSGSACVGADGYEADDVIGTLATGAGHAGRRRHRRPRPVPARRRRRRGPGALHRPRRRQATSGSTNAWVRAKYGVDAAPVRRLRHPARRRLRRAARRRRGRREDRRHPAQPVRRHGRDPRGRRTTPTPTSGPGPRGKIKAAADYLAVAPAGGRGRPRPRPRPHDDATLPRDARATRSWWRRSPQRVQPRRARRRGCVEALALTALTPRRSYGGDMTRIAVVGGHGQVARHLHPLLRRGRARRRSRWCAGEEHRAELEAARRRGPAARHRAARTPTAFAGGVRGLRRRRLRRRRRPRRQHRAQAHRRPRGLAEVDRGRPAGRHRPVRPGLRDQRRRPAARRHRRRSGGRTSRPSATPTPRCATAAWTGRSCGPGRLTDDPATGLVALGPDVGARRGHPRRRRRRGRRGARRPGDRRAGSGTSSTATTPDRRRALRRRSVVAERRVGHHAAPQPAATTSRAVSRSGASPAASATWPARSSSCFIQRTKSPAARS